MANPIIPQGVLNRLLSSVSVIDNPQLNVTSGYFGNEFVEITFEGEASGYLPTGTGAVPSPAPYQIVTATFQLLKSQTLSNLWEQQRQTNTSIGDIVITTDTSTLDAYDLVNCTILNIPTLNFSGNSPNYPVTVRGTYYINASLFGN